MKSARFLAGLALPLFLLGSVQDDAPEARPHLGGTFYLERSQDGFGFRTHGIDERTPSRVKFYPLPQSTVEMYKRLRAEDLKNFWRPLLTAAEYQRQEVIGPYQVERDRVWFGNQYYDSEGSRGVGAFGYFDIPTRQYKLFRPKEIARWKVSALLVEPDVVWLALDSFVEDISTAPGGLLRWDRKNQNIRRYELEFVVTRLRRSAKDSAALALTTHGGYALLHDEKISRFRVEKTPDGKEAAVPIDKFPPPPSHY